MRPLSFSTSQPASVVSATAVDLEQMRRAQVRAAEVDLIGQAGAMTDVTTPADLNEPSEIADRLSFLGRSLGDPQRAAQILERVLAGNELQPVNYLARGAIAARAVARVEVITSTGVKYAWGTGFLIAPNVLLTNNHVLPGPEWGTNSCSHFLYEADLSDNVAGWTEFGLDPKTLFYTSKELDFTVIAVRPVASRGTRALQEFGSLPLLDVTGKAAEGEWLTIVQHPNGEPKQLCVRENRLMKKGDDVLWYSTDTLGGSSGSPVFNNDWYVVALHHSGIPEEKDGKIRAVDGQFYDPAVLSEDRIKWLANEGIRASRIVQTLKKALPQHPLLLPMYAATPESARVGAGLRFSIERTESTPLPVRNTTMSNSSRTLTVPIQVTLQLDADGQVLGATAASGVGSSSQSGSVAESVTFQERSAVRKPAPFDAPFESDYSNRRGFDPDFLGNGNKSINLPKLSKSLEKAAVKLIDGNDHILKYHNFSVVMHGVRRFAIYSAANVSFGQRYEMSRPPDVWRIDPRISTEAQVSNFLYAANNFDRGHLTRREDLEFGATPVVALQSAADTCHWANCTPQHAKFNQNKEIWQGIERHVLEDAILKNQFKAQVITGPVFDEGDPEYKKIQYPVSYWKVVAAINSEGDLVATAYLASQADVIERFGIEAAPIDPFGPYKTFQVPISEIERLTQLTFTRGSGATATSLNEVDPLKSSTRAAVRRRTRVRPFESAPIVAPSGYVELTTLDDIITTT